MPRLKINFYENLYLGASIKNPDKIKRKIMQNAGQLNIYVIMPAKGNDLLEIMHAGFLKQEYYRSHPVYILGIANGYDEALALVEQIIMGHYKETGSLDIRNILSKDEMKW